MDTRNDEMTLKDLLLLLWGSRWLLLALTILGGVGGGLYAFSSQPEYKVDALIQLETKDNKNPMNMLGAMSEMFQTTNPAETEIEIIRSRLVLGRAVEQLKLNLQAAPLTWGRLARLRGVPRPEVEIDRLDLRANRWGRPFELEFLAKGEYLLREPKTKREILRGRVGVGNDSTANPDRVGLFIRSAQVQAGDRFLVSRISSLNAIEALRARLGVSEIGKKTGIIGLSYAGNDAERIATVLNTIANCYVRQDVEQKSAEAEKTLQFLQEQLPEIKRNLEESEQRLNSYRSLTGSVDLTAEAKLALEQQVEVQQKLFEAQQKKKELQQLFKADHPNIRTLDSVIASLSAKMGGQERQVKALPMQQQEVVRLMRDVQVNTELYTGLLNSSQQLKVVKAGEIGNVRVVDYAVPDFEPTKPKKKNIILVGLLVGFGLAAGISLLRRLMSSGVEDPAVIEKALGLPVYASVPHSVLQEGLLKKMRRKEKGTHLLAFQQPDDLAVESFRSLRTTLHFSMLDAPNRILLLVGPSPSIGKSFVSTNFAATLAMAGSRVLLIDADLRRGHIHQYLGRERGQGLSDLLSGNAVTEQALIATEVPGLTFLSTGTVPPNPSELLMHENFSRLLEELKPRYDYIVIDSAPVLAVTDAVILGKMAGTTLMVLKHGKHPLAEIEACQKRLVQADVTLKGVLFNDVQGTGLAAYRYGASAYQYSYTRNGKS